MKTKFNLALLACIFVISTHVHAAKNKQIFFGIHGAEIGEFIAGKGPLICYDYPKYYIIAKSLYPNPGNDVLVKFKKAGASYQCNYQVETGDYEIKNHYAEFFYGITNNLLFLDSGTAPNRRELMIYDLTQRNLKYKNIYDDSVKIINKKRLSYWVIPNESKEIKKYQASPNTCPDFAKITLEGFTPVIVKHVIVNLSNFNHHETGEVRCAAIQ